MKFTMEALHKHEHSGYSYNRKIFISLGDYGEIVTIFRGKSPAELEAFSVSYVAEYNNKLITIRRHCWMPHHDQFHTHVRKSLGRKSFKTIYPLPLRGKIKRGLNWAKKDMISNWYIYRRAFEKLAKIK